MKDDINNDDDDDDNCRKKKKTIARRVPLVDGAAGVGVGQRRRHDHVTNEDGVPYRIRLSCIPCVGGDDLEQVGNVARAGGAVERQQQHGAPRAPKTHRRGGKRCGCDTGTGVYGKTSGRWNGAASGVGAN